MRPLVASSAAIFVVFASPASALDLPARKPGLWDMKMVFEGRNVPAHTSQHCIDAETDKLMSSVGASSKDCSKMDVQKVGDTYVVDAICKMGPSTNTAHSVITGDFSSAYTVKVSSQTDGGPKLPGIPPDSTSQMTIEARWSGACKPDQKPGDIIMSNGMKMNIRDMQKVQNLGAGAAPKQ